ncbi:Formate--tetrahydrofolate ligase, partial [Bienertia sinuspersici]
GAVIRDDNGVVSVAAVKRFAVTWKPKLAEAQAGRFGLEVAKPLGYSDVILESDSLEVVSTIINGLSEESPIFLFYDDIVALSTSFSAFMLEEMGMGSLTL